MCVGRGKLLPDVEPTPIKRPYKSAQRCPVSEAHVVYHLSQIGHELSLGTILGSILLVGSVAVTATISYLCSDEERSWSGFWRHVLPPETLRHPSARADIWNYIRGKANQSCGLGAGCFARGWRRRDDQSGDPACCALASIKHSWKHRLAGFVYADHADYP